MRTVIPTTMFFDVDHVIVVRDNEHACIRIILPDDTTITLFGAGASPPELRIEESESHE